MKVRFGNKKPPIAIVQHDSDSADQVSFATIFIAKRSLLSQQMRTKVESGPNRSGEVEGKFCCDVLDVSPRKVALRNHQRKRMRAKKMKRKGERTSARKVGL